MRKIRQNLAWAFGYNLVAIPLAAGALLPSLGLALTPSISGALMGASSLMVVSNSLLLQWELRGLRSAHAARPGRAELAARAGGSREAAGGRRRAPEEGGGDGEEEVLQLAGAEGVAVAPRMRGVVAAAAITAGPAEAAVGGRHGGRSGGGASGGCTTAAVTNTKC